MALFHRRDDAPGDLHAGLEVAVASAGNGDVQGLGEADGEGLAFALPHPGIGQLAAGVVQLVGLVEAEAVVEQCLAGRGARFLAPGAQHHGDQAHAVALCRGHQAVAGRFGMAGLDTVHRRVAPEQFVAILLGDAVVGEALLRVPLVVFGKLGDQGARQAGDVSRRGVVLGVRQAGGIDEMAARESQLLGIAVHVIGKGLLGAGQVFGQGHGGIVAALDDHALQQVLHRDLLADLDEHARTRHAPGPFAHRDLVVEADGAGLDLLEQHIGRHQLGDAGRFHALVGILLCQHPATVIVLQDIAPGADGRRLGHWQGSGLRRLQQKGKDQEDGDQESRHGVLCAGSLNPHIVRFPRVFFNR